MARYCPTRQGRSPAPRIGAPKAKWVFPTSSEVTTEPVITKDGVVVVGTQDGHLIGVSAAGTMVFSTALGSGPMRGSAAIGADGTMYVGSGTSVYAVSPTGDVVWTFPTAGVVLSSPTVRGDGVVYVTSYDYHLYALSPAGAMLWAYAAGNVNASSPAVAPDGTVYFGSYDKKLHAVSSDGTGKWTYPVGDFIDGTPTVTDDGTVVFGSYDKSAYGVGPDGKLVWSYPTGQGIRSEVSYVAGLSIFFSGDQTLYAVQKGGVTAWKAYVGSPIGAPAITFDGALVAAEASFVKPVIVALDQGGTSLWSSPVNTTFVAQPAGAALAADGTVMVGFGAALYAVGN
jgi:outer membrane protein assembly factor BamB